MRREAYYSKPKVLILVVIIYCFVIDGLSGLGGSSECRVPQSEFEALVRSTISVVRKVADVVSLFSTDFQLKDAATDCFEMMDSTVDLLTSVLSLSKIPNEIYTGNDVHGTGDSISDMKCWLSGALVNQVTCKEGFDGTNSHLQTLISSDLDHITSALTKLVSMIKPSRKPVPKGKFLDWLKSRDQKLLQAPGSLVADVVVATDDTGNFTSITAAIQAAPERSRTRFVIYIKRGVYKEYIDNIDNKKWNIMLVGDGMDATIITGDHSNATDWRTYKSATFHTKGVGFIARDITFENTAGPEEGQAVAFHFESDLSVLYRCGFRGFQDTLYAHTCRQFYRECKITGTVDFIFGHGTAVFQNCEIVARKGLPGQKNVVTAQSQPNLDYNSGFSIQFCNITGEPDLVASVGSNPTYLGRPWSIYSRTIVMQSYISDVVMTEGWLEMEGTTKTDSLYFGEYMNYGSGAGLSGRVKWAGYHVINDPDEAEKFTVAQFLISGDQWLPSTGVKYTRGLGI
ncbi:plant invertase/pectin methylesterase inhibitor [Striga asiatica]|uniref:Pectinesterase n=1 Tax=Striga asiatica TaxID=4170 RepID=A0A5A7QCK3_STRAF|nr:plant invertase/pectin methylesterase inhibitor [Striga asiatica]